ncbi:protein HEG-like [Brachionichthys hirsutus]|uniref:protein HEG-like n=1 Tax=Brachionichthys hirsutus TaxID=412623 RepID=UPI0036053277
MEACDEKTMQCNSEDGSFNCTCLDTYAKTNFSSRICTSCPSGQRAVDFECVGCPYGYSGFNCMESWKLAVLVVGTIFGILVLLIIIILPIVVCRTSKKSKNADEVPLVSNRVSNGHAALADALNKTGVPRIPRAATTISWDNKNNLEMTQSNDQQNYLPRIYEDEDDMTPYARSKSGLPSQRSINPYAQNPSEMNSASSNGQSNPYYTHDNGGRF